MSIAVTFEQLAAVGNVGLHLWIAAAKLSLHSLRL